MNAILLQILKDRKWSILIYTLAGLIFMWMYVALFPTFADSREQFNQVLEAYPESIMETFGVQDATIIFDNIENFLAVENYSFLWPILIIVLAISLGSYSIAGEIENKTIETLLSQPISRINLFFSKYLAGLILILIFTILTTLSAIPLSIIYSVEYQLTSHLLIMAVGLLFGISVFSIASMFSVIFNEKSKVSFMTAGIIILMYVANLIASLKEELSDLESISFFHYFDAVKILGDQEVTNQAVIVFTSIIIVTTVLAVLIFKNKDISVS